LTKLHEEIAVSTLGAALEGLKTKPARGEYVIIIEGAPAPAPVVADDDELNALLYSLLASGLSPAAAAKEAAAATGFDRETCYKRAVAVKQTTAG
jgi:16S rRNA (cytidine1402-2'-O)-methyltransferase